MPERKDYETLIADLSKDRTILGSLVQENARAWKAWHRDLVRRMTLEIRGIRPAFMDDSLARDLDELRAFRHVFRNLYQTSLKPERIRGVQALLAGTIDRFVKAHDEFIRKIRAIADEV